MFMCFISSLLGTCPRTPYTNNGVDSEEGRNDDADDDDHDGLGDELCCNYDLVVLWL